MEESERRSDGSGKVATLYAGWMRTVNKNCETGGVLASQGADAEVITYYPLDSTVGAAVR